MTFAQFLMEWMNSSPKKSQADLARALGISPQSANQYIAGRLHPKFETGFIYMVKLGATKDQLKEYIHSVFSKYNIEEEGMLFEAIQPVVHNGSHHLVIDKEKMNDQGMKTLKDAIPIYKKVNSHLEIVGYVQE